MSEAALVDKKQKWASLILCHAIGQQFGLNLIVCWFGEIKIVQQLRRRAFIEQPDATVAHAVVLQFG